MNVQTIIALVAYALAPVSGQDTAVDVVFLIDGSGSLTVEDYVRQKNFVIDITNNLDIGPEKTNVGAIVYSSTIGATLPLSPLIGKDLITTMIRALEKLNGGSNTAIGIRNAHSMLINNGRKTAKKFMVVFTDGRSENPSMTIHEAQLAKYNGVVICVVATGTNQPAEFEQEVESIASDPSQTLIRADDFSDLDTSVNRIVQIVNPAIEDKIICEDENKDSYIHCPTSTILNIIYANYGRTNTSVCSNRRQYENISCISETSYHIVKDNCDGKAYCILTATNGVFTDPCPNIYKYLHIRYQCVLAPSVADEESTSKICAYTAQINSADVTTTRSISPEINLNISSNL